VAVVREGRLVAVESVSNIRDTLPRRVIVRFAEGPLAPPPESAGTRVVSSSATEWVLEVSGPMGPLLETLRGLPVADLDVERASLEDYVLGIYAKNQRGAPRE
jgi:hypothetical protein